MDAPIRIGIIGAGKNTINRHIPLLQRIPGVTIVAVANRTIKSSQLVCQQFNIPTALDDPYVIINDKNIDAVVIGTWPYMHRPFSIAALQQGKHVMVEARMAMNAKEAEEMLQTSLQFPNLITQVVPSPYSLSFDHVVSGYVKEKIGKLLCIQVSVSHGTFPEYSGDVQWRHETKFSGNNIMSLGIYYEMIIRWVGPARTVFTNGSVVVTERKEENGKLIPIHIPDLLTIIGNLQNGAQYSIHMATTCGFNKRNEVWIYGDEGTVHVDVENGDIYFGKKNNKEMCKLDFERAPKWRVEEEFVAAIHGKEKIQNTNWQTGLVYMKFIDAVTESMKSGKLVQI